MEFLTSHWDLIVAAALGVLGGAAVALKAVAPLTKTDLDDKAASALEKVLAFLRPKP